MGLREAIQKRIEKKHAEIELLQQQYEQIIQSNRAYVQALQDTLRLIPETAESASQEALLRHGSNVAKTRDALRTAGKPLHITEILKAIGLSPDKRNRVSIAGSLSAYARKEKIFTKTDSNTFGLKEFEHGIVELSDEDLKILQAEQSAPAPK
jgi:hypothetical protein